MSLSRTIGRERPTPVQGGAGEFAFRSTHTQNASGILALPGGYTGSLFTAELTGPSVTPSNRLGLWGVDSSGNSRLLLRTGQLIDGQPMHAFQVLGIIGEAIGSGRSYNDDGKVAVLVTTVDRAMHVIQVEVP